MAHASIPHSSKLPRLQVLERPPPKHWCLITNMWSKNAKCGSQFGEREGRVQKFDYMTQMQQTSGSFFLSGDFNCCPFSLLLLSFMWYLLLFCLAPSRHSLLIFCYWSISVIPYTYFPSCNDLKCYSYNISVFLIPGEDYVQNMPWHSFFPLKPYPQVDCGIRVPSINLRALPLTPTLLILTASAATRGHCFGLLESPVLIQVIFYSIFKPWIHIIHCQSLSKYQI